jgi:hypothetical protein
MRSASLSLCTIMVLLFAIDSAYAEGIEIKTGNVHIKTDASNSPQRIRPYWRSPLYFERSRSLENLQRYRLPSSRIEQTCHQRSGQVYQESRQVTTVNGYDSHTEVYSVHKC